MFITIAGNTGDTACRHSHNTLDLPAVSPYPGWALYCGNIIFKPDADTTRAMITVMLWRLSGAPIVNYALDFDDVSDGQWFTEAIRWAKSEGVADGYDNGCFGPNDPVTREQMVTILWRYAHYRGKDTTVAESTDIQSFSDAGNVSQYAVLPMKWACGSRMVSGTNTADGTDVILDPRGTGTRAQIATMMMRFCTELGVNPSAQ